MRTTILEVDCGKFSPDRGSPECEHRGNIAIGITVVVVLVVAVLLLVVWRFLMKKYAKDDRPTHTEL